MTSRTAKLAAAAGVVLAAQAMAALPVGASGDGGGGMARMHAEMMSESREMARMHAEMMSGRGGG